MAEVGHTYNNAPKHLVNGDVNFLTDTMKCILLSAYTFAATHDTLADVLAAGTEATGTGTSGYTARGATLASKTVVASSTVTTLDCADIAWTTGNPGSLTAVWAVYYKDTGTNSTSFVIGASDLGGTQTASNGGAFTQQTPSGIITLTAGG
jgi:hypothetical protein